MAYEESLTRISLDADSSLAAYTGPPGYIGTTGPYWGKQFRFVKVVGAHKVGLATAKADTVVGVLQNKPQKLNEAASVAIGTGVTYLQSGAAIAAGAKLTTDATGRGITVSTGDRVLAIALDAAAAADQLIPALL